MIVSLVGRTISGSSSCADGAGRSPPLPSGSSRWCVTTAHSLANPSTCSRFLLQEAHRNEQREVGVLVPGLLEHRVEPPLHVLPDRVAPRLDDHAAADVGVLGQVGRLDDLLVPLGIVFGAGGGDCVLGCLAMEESRVEESRVESQSPQG